MNKMYKKLLNIINKQKIILFTKYIFNTFF